MFKRKPDLRMIDTSSKVTLKMSCLSACRGDVRQAKELYEFLAEDISDMPDFTPVPPTRAQQLTTTAKNLFAWVKDNRDDLMGAYQLFQQLRGGVATTAAESVSELPPIPNQ